MRRRSLALGVVPALVVTASLVRLAGAQPPAATSEARTTVAARAEVYADDDATVVSRPRIAASERVGERVELGQSYFVDAVSTASIDVVTRASQTVRDVRHVPGVSIALRGDRSGIARLVYQGGFERDHRSHAVSFLAERDLDEARLWHGGVGVNVAEARIGTVIDQRFVRHAFTAGMTASLARVLSPRLVVRGALALSHVHGFQSSPYRTVRLGDWTAHPYEGSDPDAGAWVFTGVTGVARESHPSERTRAALTLAMVQALARRAALATTIELYRDTWAITSGALTLEGRWEPRRDMLLRLSARTYLQSAAFFQRARYDDAGGVDGYITSDRELGRARGYLVAFGLSAPVRDVLLDLLVEVGRYRYPDFTLRERRDHIAIQVGITWQR
jgi:hypothetical protein